jgi:hypothetical protein
MHVGAFTGNPADASGTYRGRCFVYVAACGGPEDLLKIGLSHDPLARWSAFHPRWFEAFDLDHGALVETETRGDAQRLETALHRRLVDHNCPAPLDMRQQAGGRTEWYRGAHRKALRWVEEAAESGHVVHVPARAWFAAAVLRRSDRLVSLLDQALRHDHALDGLQCRALLDLVDAQAAFDDAFIARLAPGLVLLRERSQGKAEANDGYG